MIKDLIKQEQQLRSEIFIKIKQLLEVQSNIYKQSLKEEQQFIKDPLYRNVKLTYGRFLIYLKKLKTTTETLYYLINEIKTPPYLSIEDLIKTERDLILKKRKKISENK